MALDLVQSLKAVQSKTQVGTEPNQSCKWKILSSEGITPTLTGVNDNIRRKALKNQGHSLWKLHSTSPNVGEPESRTQPRSLIVGQRVLAAQQSPPSLSVLMPRL